MYSDTQILKYLDKLAWDTTKTAEDLLNILKSPENNWEKKGLYIKMLNFFYWHKVRHLVQPDKISELLSDDVINGLFPRPLRDKYRYVRSLL